MYELRMTGNRLLPKCPPVVNCIAIIFCDFELTDLFIDDSKIICKVSGISLLDFCEIIANNPFVREDHDQAGSEALTPSLLWHQIG